MISQIRKMFTPAKPTRACVIETFEGRTMFSLVPVFSQVPPPIIAKSYPHQHDSNPAPQTPPPILTPVPLPVLPTPGNPVAAVAPTGLEEYRHGGVACIAWTSIDPDAANIVIEASTDGSTFSKLATIDPDKTKFTAKHLDHDDTYTFHVYTLDADGNASAYGEIIAAPHC